MPTVSGCSFGDACRPRRGAVQGVRNPRKRAVEGRASACAGDWFNDPVRQKQHLQDGNRYATVRLAAAPLA